MGRNFITPFKVGLVVLAAIVVAVVMIGRVGSQWGDESETYEVHAYFDDVTGLAERSQVRIAGIPVGEVSKVELVDNRARVTIRVRNDIKLFEGVPQPDGYYKDGATISKKLSSLLGDYYVEITPGIQGEKLDDGDEIKNVLEGGGPEAILNEIEKISKDVSQITGAMSDVFGGEEGRQRLDAILRDVEDTSASVRNLVVENSERLDRIVENVERITADARVLMKDGGEDVDRILKELRLVAKDLRVIVENTGNNIDNSFERFDTALGKANDGLDKLNSSLDNLDDITGTVARGEGTVGKIIKDETIAKETELLLKDTRALIGSAKKAVDDVGEITGSIGDLETHVDLRNDYLFGFNAFKNILTVRLQPRPTKWYVIELVRDPRGSTSTTRRTVDSSGSQPVYEEITETKSAIKFSFQFAGRYEWIAGRFGLIENTGGLGGNLYFFDDNLEIAVDLFDFGLVPTPGCERIVQLALAFDLALPWAWAEHLYLSGGIDDPFNQGTFDYFVGAGFTFNDKDLKGLLTVAPTPSP